MSHARLDEEQSGASGIERTFVVPPAGHILRMVSEDVPSVPLARFGVRQREIHGRTHAKMRRA